MDSIATALQALNSLTPIGLVGLIVIVIYLGMKQRERDKYIVFEDDENGEPITLKSLDARIKLLGTNHLHDLPEMNNTLKRIEVLLTDQNRETNRNFSEIKESLSYVKARLNGKQ